LNGQTLDSYTAGELSLPSLRGR